MLRKISNTNKCCSFLNFLFKNPEQNVTQFPQNIDNDKKCFWISKLAY